MKMKALRPFLGNQGMVEQGAIIDVPDLRARELEARHLAVPLVDKAAVDARKGVASQGAPRPTQTPPIGGPTGEAKPVLSSPAVQAPQKRRCTRQKVKPA